MRMAFMAVKMNVPVLYTGAESIDEQLQAETQHNE
jgi:hypothetical protein